MSVDFNTSDTVETTKKNSEKIEEFLIENVELTFTRTDRNKMKTVDNTKLPFSMVELFFEMVDGDFQNGSALPPTQADYAVVLYHRGKAQNGTRFNEEYRKCWFRRAEVTYPSLVRDMHFKYLLEEYQERTNAFDEVRYDLEDDVENGADAIIIDGDTEYHINLYVNTRKSQSYLKQKKNYRQDEKEAVDLHFPTSKNDEKNKQLELDNGVNFWLYSEAHIEEIDRLIHSQ